MLLLIPERMLESRFSPTRVATMNKLRSLWNDESGQDLAEYAMMIGLVALAVVVAVALLGTNVSTTFNDINDTLEAST